MINGPDITSYNVKRRFGLVLFYVKLILIINFTCTKTVIVSRNKTHV